MLLTLAYDGAGYAGLVPQDNAVTVGGTLLAAIQRFDADVTKLRVASRTDAGVHARDQWVAFDTHHLMPARGWARGLARYLPPAIVVRRAAGCAVGFSPRFATTGKHYRYRVLCDRVPDPFLAQRVWQVHGLRDPVAAAARMTDELAAAVGTHDFSAFSSARDQRQHRERTLSVATARAEGKLVIVDIEGDGFLHNMVRILVGTAVDVARGSRPVGTLATALASRDRQRAGMTAPADGLVLEQVYMRERGDAPWPAES